MLPAGSALGCPVHLLCSVLSPNVAQYKALEVIIDGVPLRHCQQCSRFEPLDAFDGDKRSCRAKLEVHR